MKPKQTYYTHIEYEDGCNRHLKFGIFIGAVAMAAGLIILANVLY